MFLNLGLIRDLFLNLGTIGYVIYYIIQCLCLEFMEIKFHKFIIWLCDCTQCL